LSGAFLPEEGRLGGFQKMENSLHLLAHPVLQHKLGILRNKRTTSAEVRRIITEISTLLAYEATRNLSLRSAQVETPMGISAICQIEQPPLIVSILRAGGSMVDGILAVLCDAKVGHIGIYRDRFTQNTIEYYFRLPDGNHVKDKAVLLVDPLVATGDTVLAGIERLQQFGVGIISVVCILISRVALERIQHFYPEVMIYTVGVEENLDERGFLLPGIGDISSRLYGWLSETHAI